MAFIRAKRVNRALYYYRVQNKRVEGLKHPKQDGDDVPKFALVFNSYGSINIPYRAA
jgi:hypothetical protein